MLYQWYSITHVYRRAILLTFNSKLYSIYLILLFSNSIILKINRHLDLFWLRIRIDFLLNFPISNSSSSIRSIWL